MIVYHGTTRRRALRISTEGFLPRKPSRRVWFAESRRYADGRARTQARRAHDRPVVLTCNLDLNQLRARLGAKHVFHRNRVIAVDAPLPISVLLSDPAVDSPTTPKELADWVNHLLGLKPHKGAGPNHPGILRLSKWVANRLESQPRSKIHPTELLQMARGWLGELFHGVVIDWDKVRVHRRARTIEVQVEAARIPADRREAEALEMLEAPSPRRRVRGLKLLAVRLVRDVPGRRGAVGSRRGAAGDAPLRRR